MSALVKSGYEGKIAGLYDLDRTLGKGHFAVVKLARHVFTGQLVAVKVIDKTKLDAMAAGHLLQEVRCMKLVQHPNVVRLYEVIDTQTKLYLILELGDGGDMYDYIMRHEGGVAEETAKVHFAQIVRAIAYCHRLHVVHRDLKPENVVFFRQQGTVKITDFGFSNRFQPGTMLMTSCGSLAYSAPEILLGEEYDAPAVDIWSLGVILYMLVCGHPPFQEANDSETLIMIMDCRYTVPAHVSPECKDLISCMLQRDPAQRASLAEIEGHPWLQGVDPSPAGHIAAPLTSHRSLSQDEHEVILQAMTSGNIADRDAIQEALEADRYNHITATYYLLGERILREKQEQSSLTDSPSSQRRLAQRPLSEPLELVDRGLQADPLRGAPLTSLSCPSPPRRGVSESGDLLNHRSGRQEGSLVEFSPPPCALSLSLHPAPPAPEQTQPVKTLPALQQICEEEEDEEEEEEQSFDLDRDRPCELSKESTVVTSEPSDSFLANAVTPTKSRDQTSEGQIGEEVLGLSEGSKEEEERDLPQEDKLTEKQEVPQSDLGPRDVRKAEKHTEKGYLETQVTEEPELARPEADQTATNRSPNRGESQSGELVLDKQDRPPMAPKTDAVQCCQGQCETSIADRGSEDTLKEKNNNNTKSRLFETTSGSPSSLPRNHCVDLGPDGVETRRAGVESEKLEELHTDRATKHQDGQHGPREAGPDPNAATVRGDLTKGKNVNLRERLLQFPLCEKALSFNIQPTSKEKLVPFAQYNCCHVL
ncbi:SNF related kinase b [Chanos chanos]|uniref:SNF-related serine/threonine-protein kinase n=1 Tax=Chanos chanos TaxID=29144 RepID=A0A6J2WFA0_CHACN|nr:SNF-related serine/threonine-protein kinase-like [Chanos chanos]